MVCKTPAVGISVVVSRTCVDIVFFKDFNYGFHYIVIIILVINKYSLNFFNHFYRSCAHLI